MSLSRLARLIPTSLLVSGALVSGAAAQDFTEDESWARAQAEARARINVPVRPQAARNLIIFVADGMSIDTIAAARIHDGQQLGVDGEAHTLSFEAFPHTALVRTYNSDAQVPDSASTATAMFSGVRTRTGAVGVTSQQYFESCAEGASLPVSIAAHAERRGLATGVVSTARLTHATPAAWYAHAVARSFEADSDLPDEAVEAGCRDIARQLIEFDQGDGIEVAMGGGAAAFLPEAEGGDRNDERHLPREWTERPQGGVYVSDAAGLRALDAASGAPVLGLFTDSHMAFEADRSDEDEPSLAEMTQFAIDRLSGDEDGYVLMVEAGRVDHAHHGTNAYRALEDMRAFSDAIAAAAASTDPEETLILVTADHGHVFTFAGYPARGNPILGLVRRANPYTPGSEPELQLAEDGRPYTTLGYHNGPNARPDEGEPLTDEEVLDPDYRQETAVPVRSESHSGADVALYAAGPRAHYFSGGIDQNSVFHLALAALGWNEADEADAAEE